MLVLIPKRKGNGYLKSCMGWHHSNAASKKFDELRPEWFVQDANDCDGYLSLELHINTYHKDFQDGVNQTLKALQDVFPHVESFVGDSAKFWRILNIEPKK